MSVLDRAALEASPLADLHTIASELGIDSFRRLRQADLIEVILERQGGEAGKPTEDTEDTEDAGSAEPRSSSRRRSRRGGRGRSGAAGREKAEEDESDDSDEGSPRARSATRERGGSRDRAAASDEEETVEGVVELLAGGSGFVRVNPPDPSDDDVYISSAQVRRCELVTGDRVSGPRRAPRRSERFASLLRVDTVNGQPVSEMADGMRFDDRPAAFPHERLALPEDDPVLGSIQRVAPIGRGSRVTISGPPLAGKSETLRRLARALSGQEELELRVVLVGVRPEEIGEWQQLELAPAVALSFATSSDGRAQAVEGAVEQVKRLVARGAHAVVLIDTLERLPQHVVQKTLASARSLVDGGSLTILAAVAEPVGGETAVIALGPPAGPGTEPVIDEQRSWAIRRELLG